MSVEMPTRVTATVMPPTMAMVLAKTVTTGSMKNAASSRGTAR